MSNSALDQSGVWRYRELLPFEEYAKHAVSLREGNTPLLEAPVAARYGGLDRLVFKLQRLPFLAEIRHELSTGLHVLDLPFPE